MKKIKISNNLILLVILIALIVLFGVLTNGLLFKPATLIGTTSDIAYLGVMALPMTFIILTAGIDLSVGFLMTATAMIFSTVYTATEKNFIVALLVCLLAGLAFGFLNGIIVAKTKIHSWLVSLATMYIFQSIGWFIGGSHSYTPNDGFVAFFNGKIGGVVPYQLVVLLVAFVIFELLDTKSTLGRYLHAIGHNEDAVIYSGVNAKMIQCLIFVMMGVMCALAGIMFMGRSWEVNQTTALNMNIEVITLVVLGGTSVAGGVGSVRGTFIATLIIGVLKKGLALMKVGGDVYNFILGGVLLVALVGFAYLEARKKIASREMAVKNLNETPATK